MFKKILSKLTSFLKDNGDYIEYKYGDEVEIVEGFYKGQKGKAIQYIITGTLSDNLKIRLSNNDLAEVPISNIRLVNK